MQCRKCLIDSDRYSVEVDASGICFYCRTVENFSNLIRQIGKQEKLLRERLSLFRNKGQYDCLVGFSGGKDSSYIIYRLRSYYGARVLAYTCDNGFLNEYAKLNINSIVNEFDIDHVWVKPNSTILRNITAKNLMNEGWPCSACFHMLEASAWKLAYENRIPYIISGRTPEQILRRPDVGYFDSPNSLIANNFAPYDNNRAHEFAGRTLQRIEDNKKWLLPEQKLWPLASEDLYLRSSFSIPDDFAPVYLGFFLYEEPVFVKLL
ncbi:hypothetical protein KA005_61715, partial [bacterium]|nr:hypothetical protein [bacterium]